MGRETSGAYFALVPCVGAVITIMSGANSRLAGIVGNLAATLVIHVVGLVAISAVLLVKREVRQPGRIPFYLFLGGFVGVGTVLLTNFAFATLHAARAVALALLGQTLFSVVIDATGFLGRTKYSISARRLPGIILAVAGVAIMAGTLRSNVVAMLVALASGIFPGLSFSLNSELGRRKGLLRSTRVNYVVGLATTLIIIAAVRPSMANAARGLVAAGPFLVLGGGIMGVVVVSAMSFAFPRIPAFSATVLVFSGQALMGVLIDAIAEGAFDARKLIGTLVLLAGLGVNAALAPARSRVGRPDSRPLP